MIAQRTLPEQLADYMPLIRRRLSMLNIPQHEQDDRAHHVYLLLLSDLRTYDPKLQTLKTWIWTRVRYRLIDSFRYVGLNCVRVTGRNGDRSTVYLVPWPHDEDERAAREKSFVPEPHASTRAQEIFEAQEHVAVLLQYFKKRTQTLFKMYMAGYTFKEIGKHLRVSESRVSQLYKEAMEYLRTYARA